MYKINPTYKEMIYFAGLALIIAHIFRSSAIWKNCTFRIFGVTNQINNLDVEKNK